MTRTRPDEPLNLSQLEHLMRARRAEVARLIRERDKLRKRLEIVHSKIVALSGGLGGRIGIRARNAMSLQDQIHQILTHAPGPLSVGDILEKVLAAGYRSHSTNFRGIINQTLVKDKRFTSAGRGMYQLKK
jgi:hypothetical protein